MVKKGFNWKSRKVVNTIIDDSDTKKINLEIATNEHYDQSNALVLPSKKRHTKIKETHTKITRILSKKQRKRLEKIVEKKQKKQNRASLLENLQKVQATSDELAKLTSIAATQTKGLKRHFREEANPALIKVKRTDKVEAPRGKISSIQGAYRRNLLQNDVKKERSNDPNVVGFTSSSSDDEEDDEAGEDVEMVPQEVVEVVEVKEVESEAKKVEPPRPPLVKKPAIFVDVIRQSNIQIARLKLPILAEEQQIMETINEHPVTILAGETGSGKTTQVPQFLYEAGYALTKQIAVTEPRRVAAIAMSKRVAEEMNLSSKEVSYLIRFEGNTTDDTKIKFMTDGVLLKELQSDVFLSKYSVVVLDEAHERSVYTDILVGFLVRVVTAREKRGDPLKLVIMSATLRLEDFTSNQKLFKTPPPVIKVDTRQFPVDVHFNKRTNEDYIKEAFNKVVKINTKLPDGGVLVFVTGQQEVNLLVRRLRKAFPFRHKAGILRKVKEEEEEEDMEMRRALKSKRKTTVIPEIDLDDYSIPGEEDESEYSAEESDDETAIITNAQPLWTLPLYSLLPSHKQSKVFEPPPPNTRLCIVSTNVAETSLTIPNIKYVVDTGKTKVKLYDKTTGVTSYVVHWTSKASADQRAGRAGRVGPGHCYRLYSSAVFNDLFQEFSPPEIQQKPVDDLYLQMRCMGIDKVVNFPFPTPPDLAQLEQAENRLEILGALEKNRLTDLGRVVAKFPVLPRFGKMLALSNQQDLMPYTVCLVAALSVQEVLLETPLEGNDNFRLKWAAIRRKWAGVGNSLLLGDNMVLLRAVGAAEYANTNSNLEKFCRENGLRHKAITEIRKLRLQITNEIKARFPQALAIVDPNQAPPTDCQTKLLRQIILAGMGDQVARKIPRDELENPKDKHAYQANNMEETVYLHRSSVLKSAAPEFVVYQEIYETNKIYMRGVTAIEPEWLPVYVPTLCNLTEPLLDPPPFYNAPTGKVHCFVTGTFGKQAWPLPRVQIAYPVCLKGYKWFALFFLQGKICGKLEKFVGDLLSPPSVMVKSWGRLQPRTQEILSALMGKGVCSKGALEEAWSTEPRYLLREYLMWLPEASHGMVSLMWPPLN